MASISQGIVFTTAMVLSSTVLYLAFSRHKNPLPFTIHHSPHSNNQILRSCLSSEEKKRERKLSKKKKKKRVQFAENVEEIIESSEGEEQRKRNRVASRSRSNNCRNAPEMPANRIALYNGILRDRVHRMECSY